MQNIFGNLTPLFNKIKILDYVPIILITLLFISENEMKTHAINMSVQTIIGLIALGIFFMMSIKFKQPRFLCFIFAGIVWLSLVIIRKSYLPQPGLLTV